MTHDTGQETPRKQKAEVSLDVRITHIMLGIHMGGELKNRARLSITLDPAMARRVRAIASKERTTVSAVIEQLLSRVLDDAETKAEVRSNPVITKLFEQLVSPDVVRRARQIIDDDVELDELREKAMKSRKKSVK